MKTESRGHIECEDANCVVGEVQRSSEVRGRGGAITKWNTGMDVKSNCEAPWQSVNLTLSGDT